MTVAIALSVSGGNAVQAATPDSAPSARELANAELSKSAATQGMVLLENSGGVLPIAAPGNVAVYGVGSYRTVKGGTGSGDVNNRYLVNVRDGLSNAGYTITTSPAYYDAVVAAYDEAYPPGQGGLFGPPINYSSVEQVLTDQTVQPTAPTDTAIFVVARNSGEGRDRTASQGDYYLTDVEANDLRILGSTYEKVVVLLNVGGVVDTEFFDDINAGAADPAGGDALDSMLLMSQGGQETGNAVAEVLSGAVAPSGKLTDTWAASYSDYPASATFGSNDQDALTEQYSEGLYVGYRYFDSKYATIDAADPASVVRYPFGFGLGYTNFTIDPRTVTANEDSVTVQARVRNSGTEHSGREVVQVYVSAPQTGLDKPYQELAGYVKTDDLAPGQAQTVSVRFNTSELSSYDPDASAYVLDGGDYTVRVGSSSRDTHVAAVLSLDRTVTTQQLAPELTDATVDSELTSDPDEFYSYNGEAEEISGAPRVGLSAGDFTTAEGASEYQQDVAVDSDSEFYALDGADLSSTTAYLPAGEADWENTGAPYAPRPGETVAPVAVDPEKTLFDVASGTYSLEQFVAGLDVEQLSNIVEGASAAGSTLTAVGAAGYSTARYESLGLPGMTLSDGPAGLRLTQQIATTPPTYQFATAFPIGTLLAQSWDPALITRVGNAVGQEMAEFGVTLWLAPGMNIHRDPLNGRNFEYYSEDPLIAGLSAAAATRGVQATPGVGVTLKHYIANNQETSRNQTDAIISERAVREIYLKGFEIAVKSAQPMAVMTSYNRINNTYASGSYDLNTDILRGEWGFQGLVMTDWGAGPRTGAGKTLYSGNDLIMPGNNPAEVITSIKEVPPTIDVSGLPVYNRRVTETTGATRWTWSFGGWVPSATGAESVTTVVDQTAVGAQPASSTTLRDAINNEITTLQPPYASVQEAYDDITTLLASTALSATQKAAISISDCHTCHTG